jgi:N-methylhydantoinase B
MNPITLAVIQSGFQQICNEMDAAFVRAAFSPVITEAQDRSDGIYHRSTGELIAQGDFGLPIFVGTMQETTQSVIARATAPREGDIYIVNDPYLGGTHLMDVKFVKPFFHRGRLFAWLANTGHWPDIGGMTPGGYSAHATEIEQEGLRIPPTRLFKEGELDPEILAIILSNIRIAAERIGDIQAQAAALAVGEVRLTGLIERYGSEVVEEAIALLKARTAQQMRAKIASIPDGCYDSETVIDSDGIDNVPLYVRLSMRKQGDELFFDLSRSSPPCRGPMNSVIATTRSAVYLAIKHVFPEVPINAGIFEPIHIEDPRGTFLYAEYPRPVSGCSAEVSQRIAEAVFDAMVKALPDRLFAASAGTCGNMAIGGHDPHRKSKYVMYYFTGGGYGGSNEIDGLSNGCSITGISKMQPVEVLEQQFPVVFDEFALAEGSAGAGRRRGGFGVRFVIRVCRGEAKVSFVMDHGRVGPPGALGGQDGGLNRVEIVRRGETYVPPHLSKDQDIALAPGDLIRVVTPGGGGYGDPLAREPVRVARDVRRQYFAAAHAAEAYGVVLDASGEADPLATEALRARLRAARDEAPATPVADPTVSRSQRSTPR